MKKILVIPLLLMVVALSAAPISEKQAREIATSFFSKGTTRTTTPIVELVWAGDDIQPVKGKATTSQSTIAEPLLYIYNRTDAKGHIVIAGEDSLRPIIAFSHDNCLELSNLPDGVRFMLSSWSRQVAAARAGSYIVPHTATRTAGVDDVGSVVKQYETALWNQGTPFNNLAPVYDGQRSVTGCVATALSIICHYNKWPERGSGTIPAYQYTDDYNVEHSIEALTLGHAYDYANMRSDNYESGYTTAEANAVATLMRDIGYGVQMMYHYVGSGAFDINALAGITKYFGYSKSAKMIYGTGFSESDWVDALIANIVEYGPTYFSGVDYGRNDVHVGHAFVLDGYTSNKYIHINYGWGGYGNAYYLIPHIDYMHGQKAFMGMGPDKDGTSQYSDNLSFVDLYNDGNILLAGLITNDTIQQNTPFTVQYGGVYNEHTVPFNGFLRFVHCDKSGNVKSVLSGEMAYSIDCWHFIHGEQQLTITEPLAAGDRVYLQYRNANNQEWYNVLRQSEICSQAIMLRASSEYIAEQLAVGVQCQTNRVGTVVKHLVFSFLDKMDFKGMTYTITNASGVQVASGVFSSFQAESTQITNTLAAGEYTITIGFGGDSHSFKIVL